MSAPTGFKMYLGDAVYADFDGFAFVLTTEDGISASNTIVLEPSVLDEVVAFAKRHGWEPKP